MFAGFENSVGFRSIGEVESSVHDRADLTTLERVAESLEEAAHDRGLLLDRARAQRRADHLQTAGEKHPEVDLGLGASHQAAQYEPSADGERSEFAPQVRSPDGIEHNINATAIEKSTGKTGGGLVVTLSDGQEVNTDLMLFATGRVPNTKGMGLENAGVELDKQGAIKVNIGLVVQEFDRGEIGRLHVLRVDRKSIGRPVGVLGTKTRIDADERQLIHGR